MTFELMTTKKQSCGFLCWENVVVPTGDVLVKVDLKNVDMLYAHYSTKLSINIDAVKAQYPKTWKRYYVQTLVCDDTTGDGKCSNETGVMVLSVNAPSFALNRVPPKLAIDVWTGRHLTLATDPDVCEKQYSPLVLDLTGEGFKFTDSSSGVRFDLNAEGAPISTAWLDSPTNALLVLDLNDNDAIDDGAELFGSATMLRNGKRAANGFEALKDLDDNHDGVMNEQDQVYSQLRLWFDQNRNGLTDRRELMKLKHAGVESIDLNYVAVNEVDEYGNQTRLRSLYKRRANGRRYNLQIIDVWFQTLIGH